MNYSLVLCWTLGGRMIGWLGLWESNYVRGFWGLKWVEESSFPNIRPQNVSPCQLRQTLFPCPEARICDGGVTISGFDQAFNLRTKPNDWSAEIIVTSSQILHPRLCQSGQILQSDRTEVRSIGTQDQLAKTLRIDQDDQSILAISLSVMHAQLRLGQWAFLW